MEKPTQPFPRAFTLVELLVVYNCYPVSSNAMTAAAQAREDFTYGTTGFPALDSVVNPGSVAYNANNCEVIAILTDNTAYPVNQAHCKNAQQIRFLDARVTGEVGRPGVGPDGVYRDPWGNPYLISMDLNYDGNCRDAYYRQWQVSQENGAAGYNGLFNSQSNPQTDFFECRRGVMAWSFGPNDKISKTTPPAMANAAENQDNILSWK